MTKKLFIFISGILLLTGIAFSHTNDWNAAYEASPADSDSISQGASKMRGLKLDVRERLATDHYLDPTGTQADHGEHTKVTYHAPIATPTNVANKGFMYTKDVNSKVEVHALDEDGNETQLTSVGLSPFAPNNSACFTWSDTDTITLTASRYYHIGTLSQPVYWNSTLTFVFGSGGSNAASDDLAANKWYAVYIDDSAVVSAATNLLTESELLNLEIDGTDYPAYSSTKHGWYNANSTSDMCIGVFKTKASAAELIEFRHAKPGEIEWDEAIGIQSGASVTTTWATLTSLLLPSCCSIAYASFYISGDPDESATYYYRPLGSSVTTGRIIDNRGQHNKYGYTHLWIEVGSGASHPTIQVKSSANRSDFISLYQQGYALPMFMY